MWVVNWEYYVNVTNNEITNIIIIRLEISTVLKFIYKVKPKAYK